jgi:hypothetical protein
LFIYCYFLSFIKNDKTYLEREPLEKVTKLKQLSAYRHNGFWQCIDSMRDLISINKKIKESFINQLLYNDLKSDYTSPNKNNPMMNVLLPEISYDPNRNEAAPSYNIAVEKEINMNTKESVVDTMFSDEKYKQREYIKKKLFSDLGDNYNFDFSMRNF